MLFKRVVASVEGTSGWMNYYSDRLHQQSEKMSLERGQDYLLVSEFAESSGNDYINVRLTYLTALMKS